MTHHIENKINPILSTLYHMFLLLFASCGKLEVSINTFLFFCLPNETFLWVNKFYNYSELKIEDGKMECGDAEISYNNYFNFLI